MAVVFAATACIRSSAHVDLPPVVSAEVYILRGDGHGSEKVLSAQEVASLSQWLAAHRGGWRDVLQTPPAPEAVIALHLAGGRQASLETFHNCPTCTGWDTTLLISHDGADDAVQVFSERDFEFIQSLTRN